ncbi:UNVERIFIED_ORG: Flp pilus assembly pilin Flp [Microbispora rosea subsp. rosea]
MNHPWAIFLRAYLGVRIQRARTAPTRGASAVEWVIITAIIAGVALGLATLIKTVVEQKQGEIQNTLGGGNSGS